MQTVLTTPTFERQARAAGLDDEELTEIVSQIAAHPVSGELIVGTGGARKLRFARQGSGKSGGYRTIHYFGGEDVPVFLLALAIRAIGQTCRKRSETNWLRCCRSSRRLTGEVAARMGDEEDYHVDVRPGRDPERPRGSRHREEARRMPSRAFVPPAVDVAAIRKKRDCPRIVRPTLRLLAAMPRGSARCEQRPALCFGCRRPDRGRRVRVDARAPSAWAGAGASAGWVRGRAQCLMTRSRLCGAPSPCPG